MPNSRMHQGKAHKETATSSIIRRAGIVGVIIAVLACIAGLVGSLTRPDAPSAQPASAHPEKTEAPQKAPRPEKPAVSSPPHTHSPVAFGKAAARELWSYDARAFSRTEHLDDLEAWMTGEKKYRDWKSVTGQVPGKKLWPRLHENRQHASAKATEGHLPEAFETAVAEDPAAIQQAHIYAVTVTGSQSLAWKDGGAGAEPRAVTLAVQCRPQQDCALAGVLPEVAP